MLIDRHSKGLLVTSSEPWSFNAWFKHDVTLTAASTIADVEESDTIEAHVDAALRGLGPAAWGPDCLAEYVVGPGPYQWSITFEAERY